MLQMDVFELREDVGCAVLGSLRSLSLPVLTRAVPTRQGAPVVNHEEPVDAPTNVPLEGTSNDAVRF